MSVPGLQQRSHAQELLTVITGACHEHAAEQMKDPAFRLKFHAATKGEQFPKIADYQSVDNLPACFQGKKAGELVEFPDQCRSALDICNGLVTDEMLKNMAKALLAAQKKMNQETESNPSEFRLVIPQPVNTEQSKNVMTIAFGLALENKLPAVLKAMQPADAPVIPVKLDFENITTLTKANRADYSDRIGRLARQHRFAGKVDSGVVYGVLDDVVANQSTLRNLHDFITQQGGHVGFLGCLTHKIGCKDMRVTETSAKLMEALLERQGISPDEFNEVIGKTAIFGNEGFYFRGAKDTNLTNFELLVFASYFGNENDAPAFKAALGFPEKNSDAMLEDTGIYELLRYPAGNLQDLDETLNKALTERKQLSPPKTLDSGVREWFGRVRKSVASELGLPK